MSTRQRTFLGVFYPESAPENWREVIAGWMVPALVILHDRDVDKEGEVKKPHYHILLMFSGKKTLTQVRELMQELGADRVQVAYDTKGSARYLRHLDQAEKVQYPLEAVEQFGGAVASDLCQPTRDLGPEIRSFIRDEGVLFYNDLMTYCDLEKPEWAKWAETHTVHLLGVLRAAETAERRRREK